MNLFETRFSLDMHQPFYFYLRSTSSMHGNLLFFCFSENHTNKIQNFMLDVMCPIIQEGDSVPQELLDTVLINIIDPQKVNL